MQQPFHTAVPVDGHRRRPAAAGLPQPQRARRRRTERHLQRRHRWVPDMACVCVFAAPLQALPVVESYAQLLSEDDALALRIWVSSAGLRVRRCGAVERDFTAKLLSAEPSAFRFPQRAD